MRLHPGSSRSKNDIPSGKLNVCVTSIAANNVARRTPQADAESGTLDIVCIQRASFVSQMDAPKRESMQACFQQSLEILSVAVLLHVGAGKNGASFMPQEQLNDETLSGPV